jgi:D-amino peptidase
MTGDVNAAIQGALEAGADQVIVTDGHSYGTNILIEELNPRARLNSGNDSPLAMVQGIQDGADGVFFVGYHARAGSQNAILDHTWSSKKVANLWLNDLLLGETGLNAALCGHFNVPVLMISGDQTTCAQAMDLLGPLEVASVKRATGRMSAECLPPALAHELICEAAGRAILRLRQGTAPKPFRLADPVKGVIEFVSSDMADKAMRLPGAQRLDGRRIELTTPDMPNAYVGFRALVALA